MTAGSVVDAISPAAGRAPLKTAQLSFQPGHVENVDALAIQKRQEIAIDLALGTFIDAVANAVHPKPLARPLACVSIPFDLRDAVALEEHREFLHDVLRRERRLALAHCIQHRDLSLPMSDGQGKAVSRAAGRVDKGDVSGSQGARPLAHAAGDASVYDLTRYKSLKIASELRSVLSGG